MTKKEKIRIVRVLIFAGLFVGGGLVFAHFEPELRRKQFPDPIKTVEEKIEETKFGKIALKILGVETKKRENGNEKEEEKEEKEKVEKGNEEGGDWSVGEAVENKIRNVIMEKSSEKIIEILKTLPPEEFEKLKKEFCPNFCEGE